MAKEDLQVRKEERTRERWLVPFSSIHEREDGTLVIRLEIPGVSRSDLGIEVEDGELRVTGRRGEGRPQGEYLIRERREGSFHRAFTLDDTIDPEKVEATMQAGTLTLTLQRKEAVKPRRISVKGG
jgi:HSP20 family protein